MVTQNLIFTIFASIALVSALLVIMAKNPVRAVLSLIVTFCATAVTWLSLDAEFLGITLVLVYVGAVLVLFLFVVMMLDINYATLAAKFTRWLPIGVLLSCALFFSIASILYSIKPINSSNSILSYGPKDSNTAMLGQKIFTDYLLQFEIAGILLLVAIIAAIALIYRGPHSRKMQRIKDQVNVKPGDRVRLVDGT